jgi:hypothetical protein
MRSAGEARCAGAYPGVVRALIGRARQHVRADARARAVWLGHLCGRMALSLVLALIWAIIA